MKNGTPSLSELEYVTRLNYIIFTRRPTDLVQRKHPAEHQVSVEHRVDLPRGVQAANVKHGRLQVVTNRDCKDSCGLSLRQERRFDWRLLVRVSLSLG